MRCFAQGPSIVGLGFFNHVKGRAHPTVQQSPSVLMAGCWGVGLGLVLGDLDVSWLVPFGSHFCLFGPQIQDDGSLSVLTG